MQHTSNITPNIQHALLLLLLSLLNIYVRLCSFMYAMSEYKHNTILLCLNDRVILAKHICEYEYDQAPIDQMRRVTLSVECCKYALLHAIKKCKLQYKINAL